MTYGQLHATKSFSKLWTTKNMVSLRWWLKTTKMCSKNSRLFKICDPRSSKIIPGPSPFEYNFAISSKSDRLGIPLCEWLIRPESNHFLYISCGWLKNNTALRGDDASNWFLCSNIFEIKVVFPEFEGPATIVVLGWLHCNDSIKLFIHMNVYSTNIWFELIGWVYIEERRMDNMLHIHITP